MGIINWDTTDTKEEIERRLWLFQDLLTAIEGKFTVTCTPPSNSKKTEVYVKGSFTRKITGEEVTAFRKELLAPFKNIHCHGKLCQFRIISFRVDTLDKNQFDLTASIEEMI